MLVVPVKIDFAVLAFHFNLVPVENPLEGTDSTAEVCGVVSFSLDGLQCPVEVRITATDGMQAGIDGHA